MSRAVRIFEGRKDEISPTRRNLYVPTRNVRITVLGLGLVIAVRTDRRYLPEHAWPTFECASGAFEPAANRVTDARLPIPKP